MVTEYKMEEILFETGTRTWQVMDDQLASTHDTYALPEEIIQKLRKMHCEYVQILVEDQIEYMSFFMDWLDQPVALTSNNDKVRILEKSKMKKYFIVPEK